MGKQRGGLRQTDIEQLGERQIRRDAYIVCLPCALSRAEVQTEQAQVLRLLGLRCLSQQVILLVLLAGKPCEMENNNDHE